MRSSHDLDLVPAFRLPDSFSPDLELPYEIPINPVYHLISKTSRIGDADYLPLVVSHAKGENAVLSYVPEVIRHGYTIAKALRIGAISQPDNIHEMKLCKPIKADEFITSYMMKTSLIRLLREKAEIQRTRRTASNGRQFQQRSTTQRPTKTLLQLADDIRRRDGTTAQPRDDIAEAILSQAIVEDIVLEEDPKYVHEDISKTAYDWADEIIAYLEKSVKKGKLRAHYGEQVPAPLFACGHSESDEIQKGCCLKRRVILGICRSIRKWLRKNKKELERLTYGKHLVYSRVANQNRNLMGNLIGQI